MSISNRYGCDTPEYTEEQCPDCGVAEGLVHKPNCPTAVRNGALNSIAARRVSPGTGDRLIETLAERGESYGAFIDNADVAQRIKREMRLSANWDELRPDMREALEIIASKISRLLTGQMGHIDSWHDIAGYARLVEDRLRGKSKGVE